MGIESFGTYMRPEDMDKLSTPPGFVSQTSFVLRNVRGDKESSSSVSGQDQRIAFGTDDADILNKFLSSRPWIVRARTTPLTPMKPPQVPRRLPRASEAKSFKESPVFNPTEEEFSDTLSYIASLRERAEPYGICCVVPPPSWKPPCLLKEEKVWKNSSFCTQVQLYGGYRTQDPVVKKEADVDSDDAASENFMFCKIGGGPSQSLETFKTFADVNKKNYFSKKNEVLGSKNSSAKEPTMEDIEKEYKQLVERPLVETGVLYGNNLDTRTFGSGFPLPGPSESCNYRTSGWNLNNTAKLSGSLLSFEDCESICDPRLSVGMCFSSQFWKSEKERLYGLCYLHLGAPRVWYSVAGCHRSEFKATMQRLLPEITAEQLKMGQDPVMVISPHVLSMEGIPVTRCVQNPGQYVIMFPGSYYCAVDCGFNCLEKANFAPLDWLPHGDIAVQQNQEKSRKTSISYDKLLFRAAREAVKCLKEHWLNKTSTSDSARWRDSCGKDGLFSNVVKSRVKQEKSRREFLTNSLESKRMDETYDAVSKRECCECFADLYISAVRCSCSDDRYSCLSHMSKLCSCPSDKKSFLYRYTTDEMNFLVEGLYEVKLSAMFRWDNIERSYGAFPVTITTPQTEDKGKKTDEVTPLKDIAAGSKDQTKGKKKARSMAEILNAAKKQKQ